ncbi:hypothetical protein A3Q56_00913 [Intoshia linei]|uniref:Uncharacterized protein n=1 Tax=Intoshia linei TaxID=1819745 RepID=A0A177BCT5_9BILA|nr:hypothetical protein A3Q56_00913 [Intoshia linei]
MDPSKLYYSSNQKLLFENVKIENNFSKFEPNGSKFKASSALRMIKLLLYTNVIADIIVNSNIKIEAISKNFSKKRDAKPTNKVDIDAFIGILFIDRSLRGSRTNFKDILSNDSCGSKNNLNTLIQSSPIIQNDILHCIRKIPKKKELCPSHDQKYPQEYILTLT